LFIKQYATIQPITVWQKTTTKGGMQGGLNGFYDLDHLVLRRLAISNEYREGGDDSK